MKRWYQCMLERAWSPCRERRRLSAFAVLCLYSSVTRRPSQGWRRWHHCTWVCFTSMPCSAGQKLAGVEGTQAKGWQLQEFASKPGWRRKGKKGYSRHDGGGRATGLMKWETAKPHTCVVHSTGVWGSCHAVVFRCSSHAACLRCR